MDPNKGEISQLEMFPHDLLGIIVSKVVSISAEDYYNCILSCKELGASANDERVLKKVNLAPLVKKLLESIIYIFLLKKCLAKTNPYAYYIKGIIRYFILKEFQRSLLLGPHNKRREERSNLLVCYLITLAGKITEGKLYFIQIRWIVDTTMVKTCWKNIKASLHGIRVARKRRYVLSLQQIKPTTFYHLRDLDNTCGKSFYYKRMYKFIFLVKLKHYIYRVGKSAFNFP